MAPEQTLWDLLDVDPVEIPVDDAPALATEAADDVEGVWDGDVPEEVVAVETVVDINPPAATAISQRLAPGGEVGGCWLGGPKTASSAKFGNVEAESKDFALFGHNLFGDEIQQVPGGRLAERFTLPPFTVLDARQGAWQDRKRAWLSLGIQSELGRGGGTGTWIESATGGPDDPQRNYRQTRQDRAGRQLQEPRQARRLPTAAPGGSARPACDYRQRQRGDGRGRPIGG
jgi:hypothetical protein